PPSLSVIIPALNEAGEIEDTLRAALEALGPDTEIIVVDGGSTDDTRARAAPHARVIESTAGRGRQMNVGARAAAGEILVFLHADTHLPTGARAALDSALADPRVAGGAFRFALRGPTRGRVTARLLERGVNARSRLFRTATGDQAIFCRREAFHAVGGFALLPLFEDVELYHKLRRLGRMVILPLAAATSDRRWQDRGVVRTMLLHWALRAAYLVGVHPSRLHEWYKRPASR
ncbi:MAG: TIGR04283 family arsenosugar biosynthesis glycosyltransferase, partial [Gemmatimonadetes bacterium]|nr:TIGR04283 family arsenosugar biosynthesis glycosyltransferase [Gemmatimonadota bacterium]